MNNQIERTNMKYLIVKRLRNYKDYKNSTLWDVEGKLLPGTENHLDMVPIGIGEAARVSIVPGTDYTVEDDWVRSNRTNWHHMFCPAFWRVAETKGIEPKEGFSFNLKIEVLK